MIPIRDTIPSRHAPVMTWALIAANAAVFFLELHLGPQQIQRFFLLYGIVPARYTNPAWAARVGLAPADYWPFLTSLFVHGGWLHILGNMWVLWIFGDNVEDRMGPARFLAFYLFCGVVAGLVHTVTNAGSTVPTVGASGAIAGVLGAYFLLFPTSRVLTLVLIIFWPIFLDLPAVLFLAFWFLLQLWSGALALASPRNVGGVAWWAHVGGFLTGALTYGVFLSRDRSPPGGRRRAWSWSGDESD